MFPSSDTTRIRRFVNTPDASWSRRDVLRVGAALAGTLVARPLVAADTLRAGPLFDGQSLGHWQPVNFGGEGEVRVDAGTIVLERGNDLTGIVWTGALPPASYTLSLEAMRLDGTDFFCALTFPVAGSHTSFVVGGWGGSLVGISSIDSMDASENETSTVRRIEDRRWYRVVVEVSPERLRASLDGEQLVDLRLAGRAIDVRAEMELCRPMGVASFRTTAALRAMRLET